MADCRDGRARGEKLDDELLQDVALQIFAHAARAMTAGKEQAAEVFAARLPPRQRYFECRILHHRRVGLPRVRIGPHQPADGGEVFQARQKAPEIQALTSEHHVVGVSRLPIGRGERDRVAKLLQHAPADGDLARIEVPARDWDENFCHFFNLQPGRRGRRAMALRVP